MSGTALAQLSEATRLLAEARTLDDMTQLRAIAKAAEEYARAEKLGEEAERYAREVQLRAARCAGEILQEMRANGELATQKAVQFANAAQGRAHEPLPQTLADIGITEDESRRWGKLAVLDAEDFEGGVRQGKSETALTRPTKKRKKNVTGPEPVTSLKSQHGKRTGPTLKQSLSGLQQAAIQLQGLAEAIDGGLLGDWSQLFAIPEAQPHFEVVKDSLALLNARVKRILHERGESGTADRNAG
jgi:hypothetical protein